MVNSRDVARRAGVSQATVSRVLLQKPNVRPETRERVLAVLEEMDYLPNANARAMRTSRTGTIGIVMERVTNPFYPELLEALGRSLAAADQRMILWLSEGSAELGAVEAIHERRTDGVIFTTVRKDSVALQEAVKTRVPFVLVNRNVPDLACDQVGSDNVAGGRAVAHYFLANSRQNVAMICGLKGVSTNDDRARGFLLGLADHGKSIKARNTIVGDFTHEHGMAALERLFRSRGSHPDAIFCVNDLIAFGALDEARTLGIAVPNDVWVMGYDDISMAAWRSYDLSSVKQRLDDMSRAAVELLMARITDRKRSPAVLRFPSNLTVRGSTDNRAYDFPVSTSS